MRDRSDPRAVLAGLPPERSREFLTLAAGFLLAGVLAAVVSDPESGLGLVALGLGAVFLIMQPHWGILTVWVLTMIRISPARIGPLSTSELIAATLVFPLALQLFRDRSIWIWHVPQVRALLAIGGVLLAAAGWSFAMHPPPPLMAWEATWAELFFFGEQLLFLIYFVYFIKMPRHLIHAVVVVLLMIVTLALSGLNLLDGGPRPGRLAAGFDGFAGNENRLAFLCVWGTAFFWSLRFKGPRGPWRPLTLGPLLILPITVLLTGSRSGLLQLALLGGLVLLEQRQWSPAQRARAVALMLTMAFVVLVVVPTAMVQRATTIDAEGPTTIDRIHTYRAGALMLAENPIFGVGPGNFQWRNDLLTGRVMSPHNSYLWALTTGGPLLLVLYLAIFYRMHRVLRAVERWGSDRFVWLATALRINLIVFLTFSIFADIWLAEPFTLLVGLTIVLARIARPGAQPIPAPASPAFATT